MVGGGGGRINRQDVADQLGDGPDGEAHRRTDYRLGETHGKSGVQDPGFCVSLPNRSLGTEPEFFTSCP